jgi:hypothetical protein
MKRLLLMGAIIIVLQGASCSVGKSNKPYNYAFNNGVGDCNFTSVSLDDVWVALVKTLMTQKGPLPGSPVEPDRPSNKMTGAWMWTTPIYPQGRLLADGTTAIGGVDILCRLKILVEKRKGGVGVYLASISGANPLYDSILSSILNQQERDDIGRAFFDKVAELLYGAVENK